MEVFSEIRMVVRNNLYKKVGGEFLPEENYQKFIKEIETIVNKKLDYFKKMLEESLVGRIKFYKDNDRPDNASTLEILLNDIKNDQLLDFMKKDD